MDATMVECRECHGSGLDWAGSGLEMEQFRIACPACLGEGMVEDGEEVDGLHGDTSKHDQPYFGRLAA